MSERVAGTPVIAELEAALHDSFARLAEAAATVQYCASHYLDGLTAEAAEQRQQAAQAYAQFRADAAAAHEVQLAAAEAELRAAVAGGAATISALISEHPWTLSGFDAAAWERYEPAVELVPDGLRVGTLRAAVAPGLPLLPAVARVAGTGHVLITAARDGADAARSLLQALALRLVVATQPGRVRLALADPSGQGQHLSAFLRLPAALRVGDLAVSESDVTALLRSLSEHVSEVNKTRLTNVYDTVEAYNAAGAGLPIPYHVLVVDGFPAGFTEESAALLARLAHNGPRAGVYIVARLEREMKLPREFDLAALTSRATNLRLTKSGKLTWDDPDFRQSEIEPDQMPSAEQANAWLDAVGTAASTAKRAVPFDRLAVPPEQRQRGRAVDGLVADIAVDSKGELVRLVIGTDGRPYHGLVGGTIRMGKSNLLHALILQLALRYPPEELELYLLDFKEVEFNVYLTQRLPHARVIASRADREFGLSVLRRFRDEIERRVRLFHQVTDAAVTNLTEYTQATGSVLPRALLIMDEFQVLFETDGQTNLSDRIATEAAFLLGDVARRGAAFGLHLLLSTQSPGGDLAGYLNTTYQQLTLRIAVPCTEPRSGPQVSEAILGDDTATKLTRPGEAIYKDPGNPLANPAVQIARVTGEERRTWIDTIHDLTAGTDYPPPVSFDPLLPAGFAANPAAAKFAANHDTWSAPDPTIEAWLGEAIEIKPPTTAVFGRAPQSNLLVVGAEEPAHALLHAAVLSGVIQRSPEDVRFTIADFAPPGSPVRCVFAQLTDLPHEITIVGPRAADGALQALIADLDARVADTTGHETPDHFFIIAGLRRWPGLLPDDEYKPTDTQKLLQRLLEEGPEAGIHVIAWADSYATAEYLFRNSGLRRWFALRAASHLDALDSDNLFRVDNAAHLASDRALFRNIDWQDGKVEKFKPYSLDLQKDYARDLIARLR